MKIDWTKRVWNAIAAAAIAMLAIPAAAPAQFSESYNFLKAVRDRDGSKATETLEKGGPNMIDTRDINSGEAAVHIVTKRRDDQWLQFMLAKGANPNTKDNLGNTPLIYAAQIGFVEGAQLLLLAHAQVDLTNRSGETPLIKAVQAGDANMVRVLLAAGANPKKKDTMVGMSAEDYAKRDARLAPIVKLLAEAKPATSAKPIAGPKF